MPHLTDLKLEEDDFRQTMTPPSPWTPSWGWRVTTQTSAHKPPRYLCKCLVSPFPAECWIVLCYDTLSPHIAEPSPDRINSSQDVWPRTPDKAEEKADSCGELWVINIWWMLLRVAIVCYNVTTLQGRRGVELWSATSQGRNVKSGNLVARLSFIWSRQTAAFVREW